MVYILASFNFVRPWDGFFVIDKDQVQEFASVYFVGINEDKLRDSVELSPKVLNIKTASSLSRQNHHCRAGSKNEIYCPVGIVISSDNSQREKAKHQNGESVALEQGDRH